MTRVKSGNLRLQVNWDSDLVCFIFKFVEANGENTDETAHKEPSHLHFHC